MYLEHELSRFEGGQLEITKDGGPWRIGEIQKITVSAHSLCVNLAWNAQIRDGEWRECHDLFVSIPFATFTREDLDEGAMLLESETSGWYIFAQTHTLTRDKIVPLTFTAAT